MKINGTGGTALSRWAGWAGDNPGKVLAAVLGITAVLTIGAAMLEMEMTFFSIMPKDSEQVKDLERITEDFPFASSLVTVIDARNLPPGEAKETVIDVIDALSEEFSKPEYADGVSGVYGAVDTEFLEEHMLALMEPDDLERMVRLYADTDLLPFLAALNDDLEREYSGDGEALEDDEAQLVSWTGGIGRILGGLADGFEGAAPDQESVDAALDAYLIGDPYSLSRSEDMGLLFINPTYTINDLGPLVEQTDRIEARCKEIAAGYGVDAGLTGITVVGRDEMKTSEQGFGVSMLIAVVLILVLMITVFRIRSTPIIIGLPLLVGIYWTAGLTGFTIRRLNILTAMYLVALVGLGVDYAIHLITGFVQERDGGEGFSPALGKAFAKSGRGIVTGAFTTAAAFFALLAAESSIVRELALVAGMGILCELGAMLLLIPALLGLRQKRLDRHGKDDPMLRRKRSIRSDFAGGLGRAVTGRPGLAVLALLALGVVLGSRAPGVELEDNLMKMEAKGLESVELQDLLVEEFGTAPDVLYLIVERDELDGLPPVVDALEDLDSVKAVDALTEWMPTDGQLAERRPYLEEIRSALGDPAGTGTARPDPALVLEELYRLEANLIEMGDLAVLGGTDRAAHALNAVTGLDMDGNKGAVSDFDRLFEILETADPVQTEGVLAAYRDLFSPMLASRVAAMASGGPITEEILPPMIRDTFLSKDGESTLATIAPRRNPWESRYRNVFTAQVETVTDRGTGMILAADQMIAIAESDSLRALVAAMVAVFLILIIDFRNLRLALITFLPLGLAFVSLYGVMAVTGIKFDFVNIIAIPLLVGIGIDDSVHVNHRYLFEGKGRMKETLAKTGTAVALTTLTTMIGFSSFIPSVMRAMRSTGVVLTLAMALAFIYSVLFYPALLVLVVEKLGWNLEPRFGNKEKRK